jgi:hypothetical protein
LQRGSQESDPPEQQVILAAEVELSFVTMLTKALHENNAMALKKLLRMVQHGHHYAWT